MNPQDLLFMQRAFLLANAGRFKVAPNPRVGAVIVHKGKIVGEGFHQVYGGPHAEVNAVNSVKDKSILPDSTIYVSLEPCAHQGKTPPCARLLEKHRFKRVVVANQDPFEKVNGSGIDILKKAGIEVDSGILKEEGYNINKRFFTFHQKKRPYIILKWAQSSDGFIYNQDLSDNWITSQTSKQLVHLWRAEESAILVGKNTVMKDNPSLTVRETIGNNPIRIVLDEQLELNKESMVFQSDAKTIILNTKKNAKEGHLEYLQINTRKNLSSIISQVCSVRNLLSVIVEGGRNILDQFIQENLWDEARIFTGERVFKGGIKSPTISGKEVYRSKVATDDLIILKNDTI